MLREGCHRPGVAFVVLIVAAVFVEAACAVGSGHDLEDDFAGIIDDGSPDGIEGDDAAGAVEDGELVERVDAVEGLVARSELGARDVPPLGAAREPHHATAVAVLLRGVDGSDEHVIAEHILVLVDVGVAVLGIIIVEGAVHADAGVVSLACCGIEIWEELVAQADGFAQLGEVAVLPDAAFQPAVVRGVCTEDRCVGAELQPAQEEFRVVVASLMAAQVVSPIVVEDVAGIAGEEDFVAQSGPCGVRVAREADGIAVRAEASPAVVDDGAQVGAVLLHVLEEGVVAPEGLAQGLGALGGRVALLLSVLADGECLLPVEPPEVYALGLVRTDDVLEECLHEVIVLHLPEDGLPRCVAQVAGHRLVVVFVCAHAVGGMEVEGCLEAVAVHVVDERPGAGDATGVPAPPGPSALVPVHVHDEHVHRDVVVLYVADNLQELGLRVGPVAAVPVAEDVLRG